VVLRAVPEVVVVVTKYIFSLLLFVFLLPQTVLATILPEERVDMLYHKYDGGGVEIDGPSVLVRKNFADKVSVFANYYVDMVTSASIDVIATASPYTEERKEYSLGIDYLNDSTILSLSFTNSSESDYEADTIGVTASQDFFGGLSTLTMSFALGDDTVSQNGNDVFGEKDADRRRFSLGFTQILTPKFVVAFSAESVIDEGFLSNPYRQVRYFDSSSLRNCLCSYEEEEYPDTRNSDAFAIRAMYSLPWKASLRAEVRRYTDSWGIKANNAELRYAHAYKDNWLFEFRYRRTSQTQADFYQDVFSGPEAFTFRARDKELSTFNSNQFGIGITYKFEQQLLPGLERSTLNFYWDRFEFNYDNFRDTRTELPAGTEPLYSFEADVIRFYYSAWF